MRIHIFFPNFFCVEYVHQEAAMPDVFGELVIVLVHDPEMKSRVWIFYTPNIQWNLGYIFCRRMKMHVCRTWPSGRSKKSFP